MSQKKELQVFAIKSGVSSIRIFNFKNGAIEFSRAVLLLKELRFFYTVFKISMFFFCQSSKLIGIVAKQFYGIF